MQQLQPVGEEQDHAWCATAWVLGLVVTNSCWEVELLVWPLGEAVTNFQI